MADISLSWTLQSHGWAVCRIADQGSQAEAEASYVTDAPEEMLAAVAHLVLGETDARAEFEAEPTAFRWLFQRRGDRVDIRLLRLASRRMPDDAGSLIWSSEQSLDTLARAVIRAFDSVVNEYGTEGYQRMWGRAFPAGELNALRSAWRQKKQPGATLITNIALTTLIPG